MNKNRLSQSRLGYALVCMVIILGISACASSSPKMLRFYRSCDGQFSYVICSAPPSSYKAIALKKDGSIATLSSKEKQAMQIFKREEKPRGKADSLEALGYQSSSGADELEFLLCSQFAHCGISRQQYKLSMEKILPIIEKD